MPSHFFVNFLLAVGRRCAGAHPWRPSLVVALTLVLVLVPGCATKAEETFAGTALTIVSGKKSHEFRVELAVTVRQRAQGLMWRRQVKGDGGMLFLYPKDQVIVMWMKNTLVPLDMVFIDRQGIIVQIRERTVPRSLAAISSGQRARAVLELAGGTVSHLGLRIGDKLLHPAFGTR